MAGPMKKKTPWSLGPGAAPQGEDLLGPSKLSPELMSGMPLAGTNPPPARPMDIGQLPPESTQVIPAQAPNPLALMEAASADPRNSRSKLEEKIQNQRDSLARTTSDTRLTPEEYAEATNTVRGYTPKSARLIPGRPGVEDRLEETPEHQDERNPIYQQEKGIREMSDLMGLDVQNRPKGLNAVDFSPLMALVDSQTGSKLSGGYTKPENYQQMAQKIMGYMSKTQDDKKDVSSKLAEGVKSLKSGSIMEQLLSKDLASQLTGLMPQAPKSAGGAGGGTKDAQKLFRAYRMDPAVKPALEQLQAAESAYRLVEQAKDNPSAAAALKNFMARAATEKGPLTEGDKAQFQGSPALVAKLERAYEKWVNGSLRDDDVEDMKLLAKMYLKRHRDTLDYQSEYFINQVAPAGYGVDPSRARTLLYPKGGYETGGDHSQEKSKAQAPAGPKPLSMEEFFAKRDAERKAAKK